MKQTDDCHVLWKSQTGRGFPGDWGDQSRPAARRCLHTEAFSLASQPHLISEVPRKNQKIKPTFGFCCAGGETCISRLGGPAESCRTVPILVLPHASPILLHHLFTSIASFCCNPHFPGASLECSYCIEKENTCPSWRGASQIPSERTSLQAVPSPKGPEGGTGFPVN